MLRIVFLSYLILGWALINDGAVSFAPQATVKSEWVVITRFAELLQ